MKRLAGVLTIGVFILCWASWAPAADKVTLNLNWFYVGDHAPYFVATEKGWYKEENLEVNIVPGKGSADVVKKVDVGSAELGIVDTGVLIVARALQGVAGAMLTPAALAIIVSVFPKEERGGAIGTYWCLRIKHRSEGNSYELAWSDPINIVLIIELTRYSFWGILVV